MKIRSRAAGIVLAAVLASGAPAGAQMPQLPAPSAGGRTPARQQAQEPALPQPLFSGLEFIVSSMANAPAAPAPDYFQARQFAFQAPNPVSPVASLQGETLYNLEQPPRKRYWWKYPVYAGLGLPRDLIDGFFGVIGNIPPLNLALTGAYEYSGAQYLMRHFKDVHAYGGFANENGHGWIDGERWGFFSNLHFTDFVVVDQKELGRWKEHNARVQTALQAEADTRQAHNDRVAEQTEASFQLAKKAYEQGRLEEALALFWNIKSEQPTEFRAAPYFIATCARMAGRNDQSAPWRRREMARALLGLEITGLNRLSDILTAAAPAEPEARYWLAWVYARMEAWPEALEEGALLARDPGSDSRASQLYFDIALRRLQELPAKGEDAQRRDLIRRMQTAVARLRRDAQSDPETRLAEGRLAVMLGNFDSGLLILRRLAQSDGDPRHVYFYGAALVLRGLYGTDYAPEPVVEALNSAWTQTSDPRLREAAAEARAMAQELKPKRAPRAPEVAE